MPLFFSLFKLYPFSLREFRLTIYCQDLTVCSPDRCESVYPQFLNFLNDFVWLPYPSTDFFIYKVRIAVFASKLSDELICW